MSEVIVIVKRGRVLFAHNTQRDPNEPQTLAWLPAEQHSADARVRRGLVELEQARRTHAVLLSRPAGAWGGEVGANEHGVTVGCSFAVSSVPLGVVGLTGTDLVRLALERGTRAEHAVDVIVELLQRHGQAQAEHLAGESRHASFLVADPDQAFALETAGSCWAVDQVRTVRALSGGLSITGFADRHGHWLRATLGGAAARQARALSLGERAGSAADLARALRDHGPDRPWPSYGWLGGGASSICAHAAGLGIGLQTTGSWLAELGTARPRHWVTATAAPCTGLFKPVSVDCPIELGPAAAPWADEHSLWWRHERFHRKLMRDPKRLAQCFVAERDAIEATWLAAPPESGEAFARADGLLRRWTERVTAVTIRDGRPMAARRAWRTRDRDARLG